MTNHQQNLTALATANARRVARSQLRTQVRDTRNFTAGCWELGEILSAGVPTCMSSMRVEEALRWIPGRHGSKTNQFIDALLEVVGCSEWRNVGELTLRQRSILVNELRDWSSERLAA